MKEASNSLFFLSLLSKANLFKEDNDLENKEDEVNDDLYGQGFDKKFIDGMLQNKTSQRALNEYAIPNEGGYVNLANDSGGETNMGIS